MPTKTKPIPMLTEKEEEEFRSQVDRSGGPDACWEWKGMDFYKEGYGQMTIVREKKRHVLKTHRLAWFLAHGEPGQKHVLHHCDNPACCNPRHLFLGTPADNAADRDAKGRGIKGRRPKRLTEDEKAKIRSSSGSDGILAGEYGVSRCTISKIRNQPQSNRRT